MPAGSVGAFLFYLQDWSIASATDPGDEALFASPLASVKAPT
jgi:hypothetical protein